MASRIGEAPLAVRDPDSGGGGGGGSSSSETKPSALTVSGGAPSRSLQVPISLKILTPPA